MKGFMSALTLNLSAASNQNNLSNESIEELPKKKDHFYRITSNRFFAFHVFLLCILLICHQKAGF